MLKEQIKTFFINLGTSHHRFMAHYLERRGWCCFYLKEENRICHTECWLRLYEEGRKVELARKTSSGA
jgi:hypothetical protein